MDHDGTMRPEQGMGAVELVPFIAFSSKEWVNKMAVVNKTAVGIGRPLFRFHSGKRVLSWPCSFNLSLGGSLPKMTSFRDGQFKSQPCHRLVAALSLKPWRRARASVGPSREPWPVSFRGLRSSRKRRRKRRGQRRRRQRRRRRRRPPRHELRKRPTPRRGVPGGNNGGKGWLRGICFEP